MVSLKMEAARESRSTGVFPVHTLDCRSICGNYGHDLLLLGWQAKASTHCPLMSYLSICVRTERGMARNASNGFPTLRSSCEGPIRLSRMTYFVWPSHLWVIYSCVDHLS